jgi:hypothetical protein
LTIVTKSWTVKGIVGSGSLDRGSSLGGDLLVEIVELALVLIGHLFKLVFRHKGTI